MSNLEREYETWISELKLSGYTVQEERSGGICIYEGNSSLVILVKIDKALTIWSVIWVGGPERAMEKKFDLFYDMADFVGWKLRHPNERIENMAG